MLNCENIQEILRNCDNAIGGINQKVYINDSENVDYDNFVVDLTAHTITTAVLFSGAPTFETIEFRKNIATLNEDYTLEPEGAVIFTQTLTIPVHGRDAQKSKRISLIAAGQREVDLIIPQNDGGIVYIRQAQLQTVAEGTGANKTDGSKYTLTFNAQTEHLAYFITQAAVTSVI